MAIEGSALELSRSDSFSLCVSWRSILCPLPLLLCECCERKLKVDFVRGRPVGLCWYCPGGAAAGGGKGWLAAMLLSGGSDASTVEQCRVDRGRLDRGLIAL